MVLIIAMSAIVKVQEKVKEDTIVIELRANQPSILDILSKPLKESNHFLF